MDFLRGENPTQLRRNTMNSGQLNSRFANLFVGDTASEA